MNSKTREMTQKIVFAALMAALCFVGYSVFPAINVDGTKVHLGNAFVVLGALFLGGVWGGLAGAVGLTLADILGGYAASAPRTFITKLVIGLIVGLVAHLAGKIGKKKQTNGIGWTALAAASGLVFNCIFEPALKYVWYTLLFPDASKSQSAVNTLSALMTATVWTTLVNALINGVIAVVLYNALRPALEKTGLKLPGLYKKPAEEVKA